MSTIASFAIGKRFVDVGYSTGRDRFTPVWRNGNKLSPTGPIGNNFDRAHEVRKLMAAADIDVDVVEITERDPDGGNVGTGRYKLATYRFFTMDGKTYRLAIIWTPNARGQFIPSQTVKLSPTGEGRGRPVTTATADDDI